jgi:hypothetical protein
MILPGRKAAVNKPTTVLHERFVPLVVPQTVSVMELRPSVTSTTQKTTQFAPQIHTHNLADAARDLGRANQNCFALGGKQSFG